MGINCFSVTIIVHNNLSALNCRRAHSTCSHKHPQTHPALGCYGRARAVSFLSEPLQSFNETQMFLSSIPDAAFFATSVHKHTPEVSLVGGQSAVLRPSPPFPPSPLSPHVSFGTNLFSSMNYSASSGRRCNSIPSRAHNHRCSRLQRVCM